MMSFVLARERHAGGYLSWLSVLQTGSEVGRGPSSGAREDGAVSDKRSSASAMAPRHLRLKLTEALGFFKSPKCPCF